MSSNKNLQNQYLLINIFNVLINICQSEVNKKRMNIK